MWCPRALPRVDAGRAGAVPDGRRRIRQRAGRARTSARSGKPTSGCTPSMRRAGMAWCSAAWTRPGWRWCSARGWHSGLPYRFSRMRGYRAARRAARELGWTTTHPLARAGRRAESGRDPGGRPARFRSGRQTMPADDEDLAAFLTARWGLHTAAWGRSMCTSRTSTSRGRCARRRCCCSTTDCWRRPGFPALADRPPDHVCFTEGVRTRFGLAAIDRRSLTRNRLRVGNSGDYRQRRRHTPRECGGVDSLSLVYPTPQPLKP